MGMPSLLNDTSLPLWAWVVIIIVASLVVLGTIAVAIKFFIVRRRRAQFADTFGDENLPQRRITVRRGRVVESSKYLSLTGSKFGLNVYGTEDGDNVSRAGARSKSPFEWWSTVRGGADSRNSQVTEITETNRTSSLYGLPTSPNTQRVFQHRDLNYSSTSLASTFKDDELAVNVWEAQPSPPPLVRNFSRSFTRHGPHSTTTTRVQTLSRIEEYSPHTSMVSTQVTTRFSSNRRDNKRSTPSPYTHSPTPSAQFLQVPRLLQDEPSRSKTSSIYHEAIENRSSHSLQTPPPVVYRGSISSFGDPEPKSSGSPSRSDLIDPTKNTSQQSQVTVTALPEPPITKQTNDYWQTRTDLHPVRSISKKGNVLRKKSLTRAERVKQIDS